ncbi:retinol dehydrogenase 7-like [Discoglossus pictus]
MSKLSATKTGVAVSIMCLCLLLLLLALVLLYRWYRQSQILQSLSDKYVLITGCDSGFGNLAAKQLDQRGMRVLATCLTEKGAEDLKKETSSRLQTVILDVTDSQNVKNVAQWVTRIVGDAGLWGLVNNAGSATGMGPNEWQKKEEFIEMLNVNLLGMIDMTLNVLPLIRRARGRIVNVSSIIGRLAILGGGYCISKFGVQAFSDSLRREMREFGVKVSIIEPGAFKTAVIKPELHLKNLEMRWNNLPAEGKESYGEKYYQQFAKNMEGIAESANTNIHLVSDCMEHALTAVYPWTRYSPGWDSKLFYLPLSYMPTFISDYVLSLNAPKVSHRAE